MFNKDFYPTPDHVIDMMTLGLELDGKIVLEPSAGSGSIIDYVTKLGAKVLCCELHPELQMIAAKKGQFLKPNFFDVTSEEISHIDFIIMNPPFSNADKHIKHAWDIAPGGCTIVALCNYETIKNRYSVHRTVFGDIVDKNGTYSNIGDVFSNADRTTDVEVALIKMFKPKTGKSEFDDYFFDMNDEQEQSVSGSGIMKHNEIREIVNRYVGAVKMFDSVMEANNSINSLIEPIAKNLNIRFGAQNTSQKYAPDVTREYFKKELQKSAWNSVFAKMNMQKYVTEGVMEDINKFVEQQQHVPFTMSNIFKMIEIIVGTHAGRMDRVLVDTFDYICSLSADNSEAGEKWKTNSNYKINRRFIVNYITNVGWGICLEIRHDADRKVNDIIKALCFITGKNYDDMFTLYDWFCYPYKIKCNGKILNGYANHTRREDDWSLIQRVKELKASGHEAEIVKVSGTFGEWCDFGFFRVKGYKKGTMHFEFLDENVWMEFNRRVAKIKGWVLPSKTDNKHKGTERTRKAGVEVFENNLF